MEYQTCAEEASRPDFRTPDFPNIRVLGELADKCNEFSYGMGEVECPQTITEVLRLMAQIFGGLCHSGLKALADQEIEEPEPEPETEYEAEFEPEPDPEYEHEVEPGEPGDPDDQDDECDEVVVGIEPGGGRIWG